MVVACLFYVNTISWAITDRAVPAAKDTLQVQSLFKPMLEAAGAEYETQLRIETALILAMVLKDNSVPFQDINAALDEWYSALPDRGGDRILNVVSNPSKEDDSVTIDLELFQGPQKGEKFKITSACKNLSDIQQSATKVKI